MYIHCSMIYDSQLLNKHQCPLVVQQDKVIIYHMIEFYLEIKGMNYRQMLKCPKP